MQVSGAIAESVKLNSADGEPITDLNPLPTTGGGGGGGSALSDTVFQDSTGQLFVYRDTGTGVPNAYSIPDWALYVPVGAVITSNATEESSQSMILLLTRMLNYLNSPMGYDKSLQRQRGTVTVESGTVTTVAALTSLNNIDTYNARMTVLDTNRTAWAQCVRARIT